MILAAFPWSELGTGAFGAFAGAFCAFLFERQKAAKDEERQQRAAFVKAQATLFWHINSLREANSSVIADIQKNGLAKINEHPFPGNVDRIDVASIVFLLDTDLSDVVQDLYLAQERYSNVIATIAGRNELVRKLREQSQLVSHNAETRQSHMMVNAIDFQLLESINSQLCQITEIALTESEKLQGTMTHASKKRWPKLRAFKSVARPPQNVERSYRDE